MNRQFALFLISIYRTSHHSLILVFLWLDTCRGHEVIIRPWSEVNQEDVDRKHSNGACAVDGLVSVMAAIQEMKINDSSTPCSRQAELLMQDVLYY